MEVYLESVTVYLRYLADNDPTTDFGSHPKMMNLVSALMMELMPLVFELKPNEPLPLQKLTPCVVGKVLSCVPANLDELIYKLNILAEHNEVFTSTTGTIPEALAPICKMLVQGKARNLMVLRSHLFFSILDQLNGLTYPCRDHETRTTKQVPYMSNILSGVVRHFADVTPVPGNSDAFKNKDSHLDPNLGFAVLTPTDTTEQSTMLPDFSDVMTFWSDRVAELIAFSVSPEYLEHRLQLDAKRKAFEDMTAEAFAQEKNKAGFKHDGSQDEKAQSMSFMVEKWAVDEKSATHETFTTVNVFFSGDCAPVIAKLVAEFNPPPAAASAGASPKKDDEAEVGAININSY